MNVCMYSRVGCVKGLFLSGRAVPKGCCAGLLEARDALLVWNKAFSIVPNWCISTFCPFNPHLPHSVVWGFFLSCVGTHSSGAVLCPARPIKPFYFGTCKQLPTVSDVEKEKELCSFHPYMYVPWLIFQHAILAACHNCRADLTNTH